MGTALLPAPSAYIGFFDRKTLAVDIKERAFPVVKRSPAQNVEVSPWLQKGSLSPYLSYGEDLKILKRYSSLTPEEVARFKTPEGIVELNQEGISLALDRRVALFFQQCILCYKMPFVFSTKGADDQIGIAKKLFLSSPGKKESTVHTREAAHSSTIPTLLAKPKNDENAPLFVYLKGGSSHAQHNATIGMHTDVNGADELLDNDRKDGKGLRTAAIKILNRVADGLDPIQATKEFLGEFEEKAQQASAPLNSQDRRKLVLKTYIEGIRAIALEIENRALFDRLIGVRIAPDDPAEPILRETVYKERYDLILFEEKKESEIANRIDTFKKEMDTRDRSYLELVLLKEFSETAQRKILEKLFAKTAVVFEESYRQNVLRKDQSNYKRFQTRIRNLQAKYSEPLKILERDLRTHFREISSAEFAYRAKVFKDLRTRVRDWTQKEFCKNYYHAIGEKVSQSWVSRMEQPSRMNRKVIYQTPLNQRSRAVSLENAKNCAATFKIDVGLFLPCLITSEEA